MQDLSFILVYRRRRFSRGCTENDSSHFPKTLGGARIFIQNASGSTNEISLHLGATFASYDAETAAAINAFLILPPSSNKTLLQATDSRSILEALLGNISKAANQTQLLWKVIQRHLHCGTRIEAVWVPSHCGIRENERADSLADAAISLPLQRHAPTPVPYEAVRTMTKKKQMSLLSTIDLFYPP